MDQASMRCLEPLFIVTFERQKGTTTDITVRYSRLRQADVLLISVSLPKVTGAATAGQDFFRRDHTLNPQSRHMVSGKSTEGSFLKTKVARVWGAIPRIAFQNLIGR